MKIRILHITTLLLLLCITTYAQEVSNETRLQRTYQDVKAKYDILGNVRFTGVVRMTSYYRQMEESYSDMTSTNSSLSFSPYPVDLAEAVGGANRGQPFMELVLDGSPTPKTHYKVGYSFNHSMLGLGGDSSRQFGIRQFLRFEANQKTKLGHFHLTAGGGSNWVRTSDLTLSRKEYRIETFEKLPWDWYVVSPKKYYDYHSKSTIRTDERYGRTATQGFTINWRDNLDKFRWILFYGKSNRNASPGFSDLPVNTFTTRLGHSVSDQLKLAVTQYYQFGHTDRYNHLKDARSISTADFAYVTPTWSLKTEVGAGHIQNPLTQNQKEWGSAINLNLHLTKAILPIPVQFKLYDIHKNVVSQEAAFFNTNLKAPSGGVNRTLEFDGNMFVNILQEVDMIANNRTGGILRLDDTFGKLKFELGNAASVEKENLYDTITIQHRVNSFSRSRFTPFGSGVGPYQRVRNRFMRSFETLGVTDSVSDYKKGFNSLDLSLKYRIDLRRHSIVLVNYGYVGSVGEGFRPVPLFSDEAFYKMAYEEFATYFVVNKKLVVLGFVGMETLKGNDRTLLSVENNKPVDQIGTSFGFGMDWDFMRNGGLFIRHKWFNHKDINFVLDKFKGQESSVELKIFF